MKRLNKSGQFFLLAAVIISAIVISFGVLSNNARVNKEPENFYDFTYDVKRESGEIIDYEVYSSFQADSKLEKFVSLMAQDIKDKDPNANFVFIYGDNSELILENHMTTPISTGGVEFSGASETIGNTINFGIFTITINETLDDINPGSIKFEYKDLTEGTRIEVEIEGHEFSFPISRHRQVIFLIQKEVNDERFVSVE